MSTLNEIKDIDTLKSFGTYTEVKLRVEEKIGVSLKVSDWSQLLKKITIQSVSVNQHIDKLNYLILEDKNLKEIGQLSDAKKLVSELLSFRIKDRSWKQLKRSLKMIVSAFNKHDIADKSELFEKNKIRNFISSSRLEGVQISENLTSRSMADVLNKYREN